MTSSCQLFERLTNRAEKPQTRTMRFRWRSGCFCASSSSSTELQFGCSRWAPFFEKTRRTASHVSTFIASRSNVWLRFDS